MEADLIQRINRNYKIKINGRNYIGPSISKLVGFQGLCEILEDRKLAVSICRRALKSKDDVFIRKLRRGIIIKFYGK